MQVAIIERSKTRHIVNLPDIMTACNAALGAAGRKAACAALSFDGVEDFPGLLRELQTVDVLVSSLLLKLSVISVILIVITCCPNCRDQMCRSSASIVVFQAFLL